MNKHIPFKIDPEFETLLPALDPISRQSLEDEIVHNGKCRDALIVWREGGILIDGHNRFRICEKHSLPLPQVEEMSFTSREEVRHWMLVNQDSRRSYTNEQRAYYRGMRYAMEKSGHGGDRKPSGKRCNLKTHERLAEEYEVSPRTILNDETYYNVVEAIGATSPEAKVAILNGKTGITRKAIFALKDKPNEELLRFAMKVLDGGAVDLSEDEDIFQTHKGGWYIDDRAGRGYLEILPYVHKGYYLFSHFTNDLGKQDSNANGISWHLIEILIKRLGYSKDELIPFDMNPIDRVASVLYSQNKAYPTEIWETDIKQYAKEFFVSPEVVSQNINLYTSLSMIRRFSLEAAQNIAEAANESPWGARELLDMIPTLKDGLMTTILCEIIDGEQDYWKLLTKCVYESSNQVQQH